MNTMGNVQTEKIKLSSDELPIEIKRQRPPAGKPEVVVVTGASAGVGRAVVRRFAHKERTSDSSRAGWTD